MADTTTAAYSLRIRVRIANVPGALGQLAAAVGRVGGNISALEGFEAKRAVLDEDIVVDCTSEAHQQEVLVAAGAVEGVEVLEWEDRTFALHAGGKVDVVSRIALRDRDDLSMAYTPGVARVCKAIEAEPHLAHQLTIKKNTVAIVSDGTAVLGLGDIGPAAAMPVMEGKALLFKEFAGIDGFPVCLDTSSADEIVETVQRLAPTFGGINLEDIAAPACFEVEDRLKELLDIPVFHDDQHGTAVVVLAALENALQIVDKKMSDLRVVIAGVGAAGVAIAKILMEAGVPWIVGFDRQGALHEGRDGLNQAKEWFAQNTNPDRVTGSLNDAMRGTDLFVGVSGPGLIAAHDVEGMATDPIVFALANPDPEIRPEAISHVGGVVATGRSDFPNQINNVLCFPGIFRGALDAGATAITEGMKLASAQAIASAVSPADLRPDHVIPSVFDHRVALLVAEAAAAAAVRDGVVRRP
jgi:malate dehydrogenase (oxaloacetate-decarboxylating)